MKTLVWMRLWEERGRGGSRPDGCSIHKTKEDLNKFEDDCFTTESPIPGLGKDARSTSR